MAKLLDKPAPGPWEDETPGDWRAHFEAEDAALRELQDKSNALPEDEVVGGLLVWSRGDGRAYYLVVKEEPLTLQWVPLGDRWQVEEALIRGLNHADVLQMLQDIRIVSELFGRGKLQVE